MIDYKLTWLCGGCGQLVLLLPVRCCEVKCRTYWHYECHGCGYSTPAHLPMRLDGPDMFKVYQRVTEGCDE